jgi:hypothetical protein
VNFIQINIAAQRKSEESAIKGAHYRCAFLLCNGTIINQLILLQSDFICFTVVATGVCFHVFTRDTRRLIIIDAAHVQQITDFG